MSIVTCRAGECSPQAQHVADAAVPVLLEAVEKDDDKEAVSVAIAAAAGVLRGIGGEPVRKYAKQLSDAVGKVWGPCMMSLVSFSNGVPLISAGVVSLLIASDVHQAVLVGRRFAIS